MQSMRDGETMIETLSSGLSCSRLLDYVYRLLYRVQRKGTLRFPIMSILPSSARYVAFIYNEKLMRYLLSLFRFNACFLICKGRSPLVNAFDISNVPPYP